MDVTRSVSAVRAWRGGAAEPVGLVPTMGALHDGHMALVTAALEASASVVVSIFVNPLQFGPDEDLDRYPRDLDADLDTLRTAGVDAVFAPTVDAFVPPDLQTTVSVAGVTQRYEGALRPGHFDGVATIVTKLFAATQPTAAWFGEKDYQQLVTIRRMVADLDLPVEVVGVPIVRASDGLALSSRNAYLSSSERLRARTLSAALRRAAREWTGDADAARRTLTETLATGDLDLDYADVVDPVTLEPLAGGGHRAARAIVAGHVGGTRLIDNRPLGGDR